MDYLEKDKTRALTRANSKKKKEQVKRWWVNHFYRVVNDQVDDINDHRYDAINGKNAKTPRCCSCWMCGNPRRRWTGEARLTLQEHSFNEIEAIVAKEEDY
ncbi:TPA: hypothetical protein NV714_003534 [Escherichia coli]|nr:hypothetical protein [Escherichia coli]